jgi:hypothetical protein
MPSPDGPHVPSGRPGGLQRPRDAYDPSAEPYLAAPVGTEPQAVEFPVTVLGVLGQDLPGDFPGRTTWDVDIQIGVVEHSD